MKTIKVFIISVLGVLWNLSAQETTFSEEVGFYLSSNGTLQQYEYAYDELLKMLSTQYLKTDQNTSGWAYLEENKEQAVTAIQHDLIPVYQENFERSEIKEMIAFYTSDTGKQLIADRSKMTETQKEELQRFYNTPLGKKIIEKQPVLAERISKTSELWSRDLYETAISLLKE